MAKKPKWHTRWKVLPHEPLKRLEDNLWVVDGPIPGMPIDRRMAIIRLADGRLVIHNGIAVDDATIAAIEALGELTFLVVPNGFHRIDAFAYKQRYPQLRVIAAPNAAKKVAEAVAIDGGPELLPADSGLRGELIEGDKIGEIAFTIEHGATKTLMLNDALFNTPHKPGFKGFVMRALGSTGGLKMSRIMRIFGAADGNAFRAHVVRLAEQPGVSRLIVSHGDIIEGDIAARVRTALA